MKKDETMLRITSGDYWRLVWEHKRKKMPEVVKFNDICGVFTDASGEYEEPQPVVVSRNTQEDRNPFGSTFCYGTDQIVVEVMDNGHIAAVTLGLLLEGRKFIQSFTRIGLEFSDLRIQAV
ncbi:hypothetical protein ANCCEY_04645 [Ancylostoma ceylanicum]|uniref:Uncharacterized protein n=1 Tax=Ancylostoma ceylanicum TaxID=53326 RepID=A0A0D6LYN2_9BILA|nr:hypothetical protein ANCCEY_04645 [Ancylostoma ceylanicum]